MPSDYNNVIVFGPTGGVGGHIALEASKWGAKVWLAMRSTSKPIHSISAEDEKRGNFERIQADLSDAKSVKAAIGKSGAKAAFIYMVHSSDHLKGSLEAMKAAGVEYVVFLSSFIIGPDDGLREIPQEQFITFAHAQIEIALEDLGIPHASLRPAMFASNAFNMNLDKSKTPWEAQVLYGDLKGDCIAPVDIGRVGGAVLVNRPSTSPKEVIYLCGPQIITQDEVWQTIKKVTGREIAIVRPTPEENAASMRAKGMPPPVVDYLIKSLTKMRTTNMYTEPLYSQAVGNIKKYSGYEPTKFADFVAAQKLN